MRKIKEAITEHYGPRCPDTEPGCPCCDAWAEFDLLLSFAEGYVKSLERHFEETGEGYLDWQEELELLNKVKGEA
ncbi:MAG: hypothetical protein LPK02_07540 [Rhodobacterales bacterium]|nr:hypothetical protein [Rhodobacterales bacterium]